ncbi:M28 family metallopeptidase [Zhouia sp. PK063]|uniref:M28 family metallopeptidase n=1 Tax=Zhouia sp. PK063 TaxID=3373602 RepID=UPI003799915E
MKTKLATLLFLLFTTLIFAQTAITQPELKAHIAFLTSKKNAGRYPGGKLNKNVINYIIKDFRKNGIKKYNGTYKQPFMAHLRVKKGAPEKPDVQTWNVIGYIEGNDPKLKNEFIVLGAHYDHLGFGGGPSSKSNKIAIHPGADDNASGTAALMEIGEKLAAHQSQLKRSILLIAFGAEEQGLLGSTYFTEHPVVPLNNIKLMINMDMVGHLNDKNYVYMGGAGTFPNGEELMKNLGEAQGLTPIVHAGSVAGSDHVSFYKKHISVLGMHTGGHPEYHTPEDTLATLNLPGEQQVCEYIYNVIMKIAGTDYAMNFIQQD